MIEDPHYRELMDYALRALSRRAHTVHELKDKLKKRPHYTPELAQSIVRRLQELNLLNDTLYVQRAIENATQVKRQGLYKLAQRLKRKGIPLDTVTAEWKAMKLDERAIAEEALKKLNRRLERVPKEKHYQKKAQFLASRGFSPETIFGLLEH